MPVNSIVSVALATPIDPPAAQLTPFVGRGRIAGTLLVVSVPAPSRPVYLHSALTNAVVRRTLSGPDGSYSFELIDTAFPFFVTARDEPGVYDPVISPITAPFDPLA